MNESSSSSSQAMGTIDVDQAFIQEPEHRPSLSTIEGQGIPVINLSPVTSNNPSLSSIDALVKEIGSACKEWGFFQVTNHGVPLSLRRNLLEASKSFFAQSLQDKKKVSRDETSASGYYDTEHTKNDRDWKEVFDFLAKEPTLFPLTSDEHDDRILHWTNKNPQYPPHFRDILKEYIKEMEKLSYKLLELIALSLGLESKRFEEFFGDQTSFVRLNYYPPCPYSHLALGVGPHKDSGALTILAQDDVGGLQVKRKTHDQEWINVEPIPHAYIINLADIIQVWSNGAYESVEHRVIVNSEKERFSIPYFLFPAHDTEVKPLKELIHEHNPPKYRPYRSGKFLLKRFEGNFQKHREENVQIHHFKIA